MKPKLKEKFAREFNQCVSIFRKGDITSYECVLGLWSVEGEDTGGLYREALHYWQQYKKDGEYSSIIGGKSVAEMLTSN